MPETDLRPPPSASAAQRLVEDAAEKKRRRADHFDALAAERDRWKPGSADDRRSIEAFCPRFVAPGARVLELGCGTGDLLAALRPERMAWIAFRKLKWNRWLGRDRFEGARP
jgi:SAM-dependent methyltransferase